MPENPDQVIRTRTITAQTVLAGRADLRVYPYRLLSILVQGAGADRVSQAVAAAEMLEAVGWELITVSEFTSSHLTYAFMRRR
ncbi:transcriptional regulator [Micromonospora auratinigra]|uniref:Uncharacterized protein n=1 Tax=Micromonospora auratinigra TaxID=261654 RepID=A0A1A8ZA60_9ACTN|nr:transcriptional regulator [Micromonospora auratinigra]SBT40720.1 hypothetical protein GA0070611_1357 [Micromonospora auratinigra]